MPHSLKTYPTLIKLCNNLTALEYVTSFVPFVVFKETKGTTVRRAKWSIPLPWTFLMYLLTLKKFLDSENYSIMSLPLSEY